MTSIVVALSATVTRKFAQCLSSVHTSPCNDDHHNVLSHPNQQAYTAKVMIPERIGGQRQTILFYFLPILFWIQFAAPNWKKPLYTYLLRSCLQSQGNRNNSVSPSAAWFCCALEETLLTFTKNFLPGCSFSCWHLFYFYFLEMATIYNDSELRMEWFCCFFLDVTLRIWYTIRPLVCVSILFWKIQAILSLKGHFEDDDDQVLPLNFEEYSIKFSGQSIQNQRESDEFWGYCAWSLWRRNIL